MKQQFTLYPGAWQMCKAAVIRALHELPTDAIKVVTITNRKRSTDQNSKWHAMAGELAQELGYTPEELKRLAKHELGRYTVIDGPVGKIKRLQSSADWTFDEMSEAIELLNRWATEVNHRWRVE